MPLSVAIITLNEADRISDCLKSVSFADEILLVDSGSQDNTVDIAKTFGCRVIFNKWPGYARQKQYAVDQCSNEWVLIIDADERVPENTAKGIQEIINSRSRNFSAYSFFRKNFFHGRWIRHCGWWPDRVIRLVNPRKGYFDNRLVHEKWIPDGKTQNLDLFIEHYSFRNYEDLIHKMQKYSSLSAEELIQKGEKPAWWSPAAHGLWMFIRTYFIERGVLEGFDGFMISLLNAEGSFMKYAKARELQIYQKYKL